MRNMMDCRRAEELFSDHLDSSLDRLLAADLEAHLRECKRCPLLYAAMAEVVAALQSFPALEPAVDLSERAATAALRARRVSRAARPAVLAPAWLQVAAAVVALVTSAGVLYATQSKAPARAAGRLLERSVNASAFLLERKDRLMEDVRLLRVVISTAFEGRIDRMNDRVDDYRRLLEKRRLNEETKKGGGSADDGRATRLAARPGFRTGIEAAS